jgi:ubiquinone biosynthesis protein COQ9
MRTQLASQLRQNRIKNVTKSIDRCLGYASYHSYDHPSPPPYSTTANAILSASIAHIPIHGFSSKSLQLGAQDAGYLPISTNLFPRGIFDLISYYLVTRRLALKDIVNGEEGVGKVWEERKLGPGARVRELLLARLRMNGKAGVVGKWPEVRLIVSISSTFSQRQLWV